ncbi:MAG: BON domain-containing protein, partial [Planctomycetota bacterium]
MLSLKTKRSCFQRWARCGVGLLVIFLACPIPLCGQDTDQQDETPAAVQPADAGEKPEAPEKVDVQPVARDDQIANRLQEILEATQWFSSPSVQVKNGVVFLGGQAAEQDYRRWATELAQNTQDVVAVVNRMTVRQRPLLDLSPAVAELRDFAAGTIQILPLLAIGIVILLLSWWGAVGMRSFAEWGLQRRIGNPLLRNVVSNVLMLPVLLLGVYLVLRMSGLTQLALTVLGGTGIAGLVVGIAFRDIAENFLASILISLRSPFRLGDQIQVDQYHGYVRRLSTRGTLLMTLDGNHVMIPNSIIYKSVVANFTANPNRRLHFTIGIGYDDSVAKVQEIIKRVLQEHPLVLDDPEPRVIVHELGAATVNIRVYFWIDASRMNPEAARSSVMR